MSLTRLSRALLIDGQAGRALAGAKESASIFERAQLLASPGYADAMSAKAEAEERQGELAAAQASYRDRRSPPSKKPTVRRTRKSPMHAKTSLALALRASSEYAEALRTVLDAEAIERDHAQAVIRYLPERQALSLLLSLSAGSLDIAMSLVEGSPRSAAIVFDRVIRSRSIVLDEMARRHRLDGEAPSDVRSMRLELIAMRQRLANLLVRGPGNDGLDAYFRKTGDLRDNSERIERALADKSAAFRAEQQTRNTGLSKCNEHCPTAASSWPSIATSACCLSCQAESDPRAPSTSVAMRRRGTWRRAALGLSRPDDDSARRRRDDGRPYSPVARRDHGGPTGAAAGTEQRVRELGIALRRRVWDPFAAQLVGTDQCSLSRTGRSIW